MKSFEKIIGYESVKKELYQIIDMFKNREMYERMDAKLPKGVLIYGNPGMGKTMLANALIEECNVKSFVIKKNKDDKEILDEISKTFAAAAKEENAIILFDDLDKFSESDGKNVDDKIFIAVQAGIDSVKDNNVLVIATANNIRKLPDSLIRNGRFDVKIYLNRPTSKDAQEIIKHYLKNKKVNPNLNLDDVSKMISYTSCVALETILNESAIIATYQRKEKIDIDDIVKAYLKDQYNSPDEDHKCNDDLVKETALHEAGHATIAEVLKEGSVGFISVNTSYGNNMAGFTHLCDQFMRRPEVVLVALGGKAAVELYHEGKCGSGCQEDLKKAASILRDGITDSGTCGLGMIDVGINGLIPVSESLNKRQEAVVVAELERLMFITKDILIKNKDLLMGITNKLKEKHILLHSDIKEIRKSVKVTEAGRL